MARRQGTNRAQEVANGLPSSGEDSVQQQDQPALEDGLGKRIRKLLEQWPGSRGHCNHVGLLVQMAGHVVYPPPSIDEVAHGSLAKSFTISSKKGKSRAKGGISYATKCLKQRGPQDLHVLLFIVGLLHAIVALALAYLEVIPQGATSLRIQ